MSPRKKKGEELDYEADQKMRGKAWEKRQRALFKRLKHPRLRILVEGYYDMQKLRMSMDNRMRIYSRFDLITPPQAATMQTIITDIRRKEKVYANMIADELKGIPVYFSWLKNVKGIGPVMAAGLIAWTDNPARFDTVSKLWAYAVGKPGERRRRGEKVGFNPRLKMHCWKIASQMLKAKGSYAELYYQFKTVYSQREDIRKMHEELAAKSKSASVRKSLAGYKNHIHNMAMRKMVKVFLQHLWVKWREMEGLPVSEPYSIAKLGHTGYIPPEKMERKLKGGK